ncbi:hypothetical protein [Paraburkholderia acidisoli]|uniref:Uncharacterized protein n=1 Tax=Paraburkholderia acidisoli TaxID=2571748 RepID=A0A7Z2GF59_9BURK|nr:hypothetical protein [Paraburkholderia acidisoli]QGZ60662.1 hypothetical protein FAZ98_02300 [Paraburkholderia acidisoli]
MASSSGSVSSPAAMRKAPRLAALARGCALASACAVCLAWPFAAQAQQRGGGSSSSTSSASSSGDTSGDTSGASGNDLSSAIRRSKADEQRLMGGPSTSQDNPYAADPYTTDGASPAAAEHKLTSESRMTVMNPSDFYAASSASAASPTRSGDSNIRKRIGQAGSKYSGTAAGNGKAAYDYGASQTSPAAQLYGSPYASQRQSAGQLYKSPW